ncbi:MAG: DMT family transporter, partial [Planctomycetes bacterium]|nr:DMT family transporter [Planctomycetota bacterium]
MRHLPRLALLIQTVIAAGTFIVANDVTQELGPLQVGWLRILLSFVFVLPFYLMTLRRRRIPDRADMGRLALLGLTGITANQMLFLFGIQLSPPLNGALFYAFTPVMVLVIAVMLLGERLTVFKTVGVGAAVVGVLLVLYANGLDLSAGPGRGDVLLLLAVSAWAGYTVMGKPLLEKYDALTVTVWAFGFGALSMLPATPWVFQDLDL